MPGSVTTQSARAPGPRPAPPRVLSPPAPRPLPALLRGRSQPRRLCVAPGLAAAEAPPPELHLPPAGGGAYRGGWPGGRQRWGASEQLPHNVDPAPARRPARGTSADPVWGLGWEVLPCPRTAALGHPASALLLLAGQVADALSGRGGESGVAGAVTDQWDSTFFLQRMNGSSRAKPAGCLWAAAPI